MEKCQVCKKRVEDIRHVGVECFYDVHEIVPKAEKKEFFQEVSKKEVYWGYTRHYPYPAGKRDKFHTEDGGKSKYGTPITKVINEPVEIPGIRLLETAVYSIQCCKQCRGDFLAEFKKWACGDFINSNKE
jgi:hypothetical protein